MSLRTPHEAGASQSSCCRPWWRELVAIWRVSIGWLERVQVRKDDCSLAEVVWGKRRRSNASSKRLWRDLLAPTYRTTKSFIPSTDPSRTGPLASATTDQDGKHSASTATAVPLATTSVYGPHHHIILPTSTTPPRTNPRLNGVSTQNQLGGDRLLAHPYPALVALVPPVWGMMWGGSRSTQSAIEGGRDVPGKEKKICAGGRGKAQQQIKSWRVALLVSFTGYVSLRGACRFLHRPALDLPLISFRRLSPSRSRSGKDQRLWMWRPCADGLGAS